MSRTSKVIIVLIIWVSAILGFYLYRRPPLVDMTILARMVDHQDRWFREKIKEFERRNRVQLEVVTFELISDVDGILRREKDSGNKTIGLVKTHKEMIVPLVEAELMNPLDETVVDADQLQDNLEEYLDFAVDVGNVNGTQYYLPRKLEAITLLYLKSKVADAVEHWREFEDPIREMFRNSTANSHELPADYVLEEDPNQWDWYDLAVVSYYWAHTQYEGEMKPRMAHRARRYSGTMTEIAAKIFQVGGDDNDLLEVETESVYDAFEWEAFFRKNNLYNPAMWERRWDGSDIWTAILKDEVFLAFMHQLDAFFIHGLSPALDGYLDDPDDMGTAIIPRGVSMRDDNPGEGKSLPNPGHYSVKSGWWWGIPKTSPNKELSYKLARFITSYDFHHEEVSRFGMIPVTKELFADLDMIVEGEDKEWMQQVFDTGQRQLNLGNGTIPTDDIGVRELPTHEAWPLMQEYWLDAWDEIVVKGNYSANGPDGKVDREHIKKVLEPYGEKIRELAEGGRTPN